MKIAVFGAGAIGGYLGARLALAGDADVSLVARGPHLAAIQANGLTLESEGQTQTVAVRATDDPSELGPQDAVILALKAHSVPGVVDAMQPLLGDGTPVVTAQNGLPWWYFHRVGTDLEGTRIQSVDPGGRIWDTLGPERAIGCVVNPAAEISSPGVILHRSGNRFPLGEPDGERSDRVVVLSDLLNSAGLKAPVRRKIRNDIWIKLWGNLSFNPISALTGATLEQICADPDTRALAREMMLEAQAVAEALDVEFPIDVDRRIDGAAKVGAHKTSMLVDLEEGRHLEIDALVSSVQEVARIVDLRTPRVDEVSALLRQRARLAGCF